MYARSIIHQLLAALLDTPVVVLHGPRQAGKSTLARLIAEKEHPARYLTLDDAGVLSAVRNDPAGFLADLAGPVVLDEIQRVPELLLAIKAEVDRHRRPGRFLLTGSANVLQLPHLADTLTGRMEILTLYPLSQGELHGDHEGFIDALFAEDLPADSTRLGDRSKAGGRAELLERVVTGGYPEAVARQDDARRHRWFENYLGTMLLRDVRDLANIAGLSDLPRLLAAVAGRAANLLNYSELGRDVGMNQVTVKRYLTLLQATFLVTTIKPWFTSRIKRVMKSEKVYLGDTGLLAHLLNVNTGRLKTDPKASGQLLENFVAVEMMKQRTWSGTRPEILHFRDRSGHEVDLVMEARGEGKIVGVEVKFAATVKADDFKGLKALAQAAGERFHRGVVLYTGSQIIPFGANLHALPVDALWRMGAVPVR